MSVRRRQGKWSVDVVYHNADGKTTRVQRVSPVPTHRGAMEFERQIRASLLDGSYGKKKEVEVSEVPTLNEFLDSQWLPVYPSAAGYREKTKICLNWALGHVRPELGEMRLNAIGPRELLGLLATFRSKALSEKSAKTILSMLHKVLVTAHEWGVLETMPRFPKIKAPEPGFDHLSKLESRALIDAAGSEERLLILFALHTGVRLGELLPLRWDDIDYVRHDVIIRRNRPSGSKITGPTKTGKERRIPLSNELEAALRQGRHLKGKLIFCQHDGSSFDAWHLHHALERSCRKAGLRLLHWHVLRHTFASQAVASGVPINVVQSWLGHSTIVMTMRYAHLAPDAGARWIEVASRALDVTSGGKVG
jgi:integrase